MSYLSNSSIYVNKDLLALHSHCQNRDSGLGKVWIMRENDKAESE